MEAKEMLRYILTGYVESALSQAEYDKLDWIFVGLKLGHPLPVIAGYDLNQEPNRESMATV
jgi:hypothetical protein